MKIYTRLITAFLVVILLAVALGLVGMVMTSMMSSKASEIYDMHVTGIKYLAEATSSFDDMRISVNKAVIASLTGDAAEVNSLKSEFESARRKVAENLSAAEKTLVTESSKSKLATASADVGDYERGALELFSLCAAGGDTAAIKNKNAENAAKAAMVGDEIDAIMEMKLDLASQLNDDTDAFSTFATIVSIALLAVIAVGSIAIAVFIATGVEKSLKNIINTLSMSTMNISSSATQLNDASESLATGSSRQAAAIEETSATMNETSSMVQQNAENTRVASQIATTALNEVNEAGQVMGNLMGTMSELKESSDKVSKIVKTIDDIAFQTNLLAINATVEAARAGGDAGRSFAVVAQEVRSLAQRSADSSKETADIIERNIALTDTSRSGAEQVMTIAGSNAKNIENLTKLISEINAASEEQASGVKQINIAMSQMEKVTQENAAVAEENAASSNSMKDEISNLEEAIVIAKGLIRDSENSAPPRAAQAPRPQTAVRPAAAVKTNTTAYKAPASTVSAASAKQKNDAEKIIPLDDDDDF